MVNLKLKITVMENEDYKLREGKRVKRKLNFNQPIFQIQKYELKTRW